MESSKTQLTALFGAATANKVCKKLSGTFAFIPSNPTGQQLAALSLKTGLTAGDMKKFIAVFGGSMVYGDNQPLQASLSRKPAHKSDSETRKSALMAACKRLS